MKLRFKQFALVCVRQHWWTTILVAISCMLATFVWQLIVWPAYTDPIARLYTSRLGYATVLRKANRPFPVEVARVERRDISSSYMGEGLVRSEPVQVPLIATSRILRVHAQEGDMVEKGQLLVELDTQRIEIKIAAAEASLATARAESERTRIGSDYVLEKERPERDQLRLAAAEKEARIRDELDALYDRLAKDGLLSQEDALLKKIDNAKATAQVTELKFGIDVAQSGRVQSLEIAASAIREAELTVEHRKSELLDYRAHAPASGFVERCLIHEGEFNQTPGRPAFLIASGQWFEAFLDQTAIGEFKVGARAEIRLEAFPNRKLTGTVKRINPIVSYSLGGPETSRPIRPLGTGAPEWPATFGVRIALDHSESIVPGLTGFARIHWKSEELVVPRGAVTRISGNKAIVFVVEDDGFSPREVTTGVTDDQWTAILDGLEIGEVVISQGHQVLEEGDKIEYEAPARAEVPAGENLPLSNDLALGLKR